MNTEALQKAIKSVKQRYPRIGHSSPKVTAQGGNYLITFKQNAQLPGGKSLEESIRAVADEQGNIIKITSSKG